MKRERGRGEEKNEKNRHSSRVKNRETTGKKEGADKEDLVETGGCQHL